MRRRALVIRLVVLAGLVVVLVLAALLSPQTPRGGLDVATTSASVEPAGVLQGALVASRRGDQACYSMTVRGMRSVLRFVPGWSANDDLGLIDPSGAVVAPPQSTVVLLGRPGAVGSVAGCSEQGRIWTITSAQRPTR